MPSRHRSLLDCIFVIFFSVLLNAACDSHLKGEPPLHKAAYKGDIAQIEALIGMGEKVNSRNSEGATPLHWAAFKGQLEAAKLLIKYGADVNARTTKGSTPLRLATTHKKEALIKLLVSYGGEE